MPLPPLDPDLLPALPREVVVETGRVARADRGACEVLCAGGSTRATWGADVVAASSRDPEAVPVTGDWVALAHWPDDRTTVEVVLPRESVLRRAQVGRGSSQVQVLAANVDVVAVVEALVPEPVAGRLERLLALAWSSGAEPVVVLTKADLVSDAEQLAAEAALLAPGCPVLAVSASRGSGVDALRRLVHADRTMALVGASGAGKSTLLNALLGDVAMRTAALRADGKGRHTTVTRELHELPGGGSVIDTPGLRSIGLAGSESLDDVFADVLALAAGCRFGNCSHAGEPGCAVLAAVDAGKLPERRLASYRKLGREVLSRSSRRQARPPRPRGYRA